MKGVWSKLTHDWKLHHVHNSSYEDDNVYTLDSKNCFSKIYSQVKFSRIVKYKDPGGISGEKSADSLF